MEGGACGLLDIIKEEAAPGSRPEWRGGHTSLHAPLWKYEAIVRHPAYILALFLQQGVKNL